ncbi:hypothetical protein [Modicisalibacter luteus]|uniref:Uncharacterized protein n=1 Tax=Modicisalibacter luteus TaxID=453962 RepID=A0ABV7LZ17_9GAMM|nr:hypothetical protein [Halomonas lutea]
MPPAINPHRDSIEATHRLLQQYQLNAIIPVQDHTDDHWTLN